LSAGEPDGLPVSSKCCFVSLNQFARAQHRCYDQKL
jgi:hypothetical protein